MLTVWPNYYPRFRCIADRCRHTCCAGWEIDIDEESLERFQNTKGVMGERLRAAISEGEEPHFVLQEGERCPFLNGDNLCDLILYGGESFLCQICTDHPRYRNFLPGRTEIGVGLCCEAAGQLILSRKEPMTLCVTGEKEETAAEALPILALRQEAFEIAQDRTKTLTEREETLLEHFLGWVPELSISQWAEVYLELERLDDVWTDVLENLRTHGNGVDLDGFSRHMKDRE